MPLSEYVRSRTVDPLSATLHLENVSAEELAAIALNLHDEMEENWSLQCKMRLESVADFASL